MVKKRFFVLAFSLGILLLAGSDDSVGQVSGKWNAPDFTLTDIDGIEHHLYDYLDSGKVVIVDFFAVWCGICQSNTPVLESIYKKYGPEGSNVIELLSLEGDNSTTDQQVRNFIESFNATNPHINETLDTGPNYELTGFPYYYVVAPDRSYEVFPGTQVNLEEELSKAIEASPALREVEDDVRLIGFDEPKGTYCDVSIIPKILYQNYGKNEITDLVFDVRVDGELLFSQHFTDTLTPYNYAEKTLPIIENLQHGWHEFEVSVVTVNSNSDAEDNNGLTVGSFLFLKESENVVIQLTTDTYPAETYWEVLEDGKIAAERQSFNRSRTTFSDTICLEGDHCYSINIYDRFGDGLSEGGIKVIYKGEDVVSIDYESFNGISENRIFCVESGVSGFSEVELGSNNIEIFPNPTNGQVYFSNPNISNEPAKITILSITGQVLYEEKVASLLSKKTLDLSAFSNGIIFLRIALADQIVTKKIIVKK